MYILHLTDIQFSIILPYVTTNCFNYYYCLSWLLMITLERLFPYTKWQRFFREGFFYDFFSILLQSYLLGLIIFAFQLHKTHTDLYNYSLVGNWPVWVQVRFFVVTTIFIFIGSIDGCTIMQHYGTARSAPPPRTVDWLSGSCPHSLEILINQTVEFAPIILLGAAPGKLQFIKEW